GAHRDGVPGDGEGAGGAVRPAREADGLPEDCRQRPEARARVLPDLRHADLRDVAREPDCVQSPPRDHPPAEGIPAAEADLVRVRPALVDERRGARPRGARPAAVTARFRALRCGAARYAPWVNGKRLSIEQRLSIDRKIGFALSLLGLMFVATLL